MIKNSSILDDPRLGLWADLARDDEMRRENITFLEKVLICARDGNWPGVEFTLRQFLQNESRRLRQKLATMERSQVELYSGDRTVKAQEQSLWQELDCLMRAFLEAGEAKDNQLREAIRTACTGEQCRDAYFWLTHFRQNTRIVLHTYRWLHKLTDAVSEETNPVAHPDQA